MRSFDQRQHGYHGYVLRLDGTVGEEKRTYSVAIGKGAQAKHGIQAADKVSGEALPVADPRLETAEFYKVSKLKVSDRGEPSNPDGLPFLGVPPELEIYRERGHLRLDAKTYAAKCTECIWGCRMPVEMIVDHWNPREKKYRYETFCYGPKSCPFYKSGPLRKVPGRKGMVHTEEEWIDNEYTAHRSPDD